MGRILKGLAVFGGVLFVIPPLRHHLDQKIWKHVRNYNTTLSQKNRFNTQEEFYEFLGNVGHGFATIFSKDY